MGSEQGPPVSAVDATAGPIKEGMGSEQGAPATTAVDATAGESFLRGLFNPEIESEVSPERRRVLFRRPPELRSHYVDMTMNNFTGFCSLIRRSPMKVVRFLSRELGVGVGVDWRQQRSIIPHRWIPKNYLNSMLLRFVREYVMCWECKSFVTTMSGTNLICDQCGTERSVKPYHKAGFSGPSP